MMRLARFSFAWPTTELVPTVLRGNAVFDAPRRLPAGPGRSAEDAERPGRHSHAERGNEDLTCATRGKTALGLMMVVLTLGSMPGCGMAVRKLDAETLAAATTAVRSFPESPHRVALATFEMMRGEMASAEFAGNSEFAPYRKRFEGNLPANFPAFRLEWTSGDKPVRALVTLKAAHFAGKAKDGRPIEVNVEAQPGETLVTIHVDQLGDRMFSNFLFDQVAQRLAHPTYPPGSPEEAEAFQAFFGGVESRERLPSIRKPDAQGPPGSSAAASRSR